MAPDCAGGSGVNVNVVGVIDGAADGATGGSIGEGADGATGGRIDGAADGATGGSIDGADVGADGGLDGEMGGEGWYCGYGGTEAGV